MQADILSAEEIKKYLTKERKNNIAVFDTVDSTNTILKNWCAEGKARPGDCVTADCQTKGRGRRGKRFESDKGVGIYLSFLLGTGDATPDEISEITAWGAVAVRRAIEKVCHAGSKIKWVNDIVCGRMKICGILTEAITDFESGQITNIVVGIGINCSCEDFPDEIQEIAGGIPGSYSKNALAAEVVNQLLDIASNIEARDFIDEYRQSSMVIGKNINVIKTGREPAAAFAEDIDNNGALIVRYPDGTREALTTGEVSIRLR